MELSSVVVIVSNFILVALLPVIFFRRDGKLTPMWLATAAPFGIAPVLVVMAYHGFWLEPWIRPDSPLYTVLAAVAVPIALFSVGLIFMTLGTHRIPVALWHQRREDDEPAYIVTWGSYKYVRHPFYSAFLLAFVAAVMTVPHASMLALAVYTAVLLNYTAQREERRLAAEPGPVGEQYRAYMQCAGRFLPRWRARRSLVRTPAG